MPDSVHAAAAAALLAWALAPLWKAGLVGEDLALFRADARGVGGPSSLAQASLEWTQAVFGTPGWRPGAAVRALRAENALYLFLACLLGAALLRRILRGWLGEETAGAAQRAALLLLPLQPWCLAAVACASARGELLGLFLAALAALAFLRARQEQERGWLVLGLGAAALAGWADAGAWRLALLLTLLEWLVARRQRGALARLRTTLSTLAAFALVTLAPGWIGAGRAPWPVLDVAALPEGLGGLGLVLMPLHPARGDFARWALAGSLLLLAIQPALVAARSAPRTWGRLALAWSLWILVLSFTGPGPDADGSPELARLRWLCLPALALGSALAAAATAQSGAKRAWFPWVLALALLALDRPIVQSWRRATQRLESFARELRGLASPAAPEIAILAPPEFERGLRLLPARDAAAWCRLAGELPVEPVLLDARRLCDWAASASFPADLLVFQPAASSEPPLFASVLPHARRLQRRSVPDERVFWRETVRSPSVLDVDPQWLRCVRAVLHPDTPRAGRPVLAWRPDDSDEPRRAQGVWIARGSSVSASFDLARDARWLLHGPIRRVWFELEADAVASAEIVPGVAELALAEEPHALVRRWSARLAGGDPAEAAGRELAWNLVLFDPLALEGCTLAGRRADALALEFEDDAGWSTGRGTLEWSLEALLEGVCVARARGRR